jgi:hypothetical protein
MIQPALAAPGDTVTLFIKVRIAPGCWIYALDNSGSVNLPTSFETAPTSLILPSGGWVGPEPKAKEGSSRIHSGEALFQRRFIVERESAAGQAKVALELKYQVCNEALCWPPETKSLEASFTIRKSH